MPVNRFRALLVLCLLLAPTTGGCRPVEIRNPDRFIELERDPRSPYAYRAASADGVVLGVRVEDADVDRGGDLDFWTEAMVLRLRDRLGYALLAQTEVTTAGGVEGRQLRFGRDDKGHTYRYWVTVFLVDDTLHVVEAGGPEDIFKRHQVSIDRAIASLQP